MDIDAIAEGKNKGTSKEEARTRTKDKENAKERG